MGHASFKVLRHSLQSHDLFAPVDWHIASWGGLGDNHKLVGGDEKPSVLKGCIHGSINRERAPKAHVCMPCLLIPYGICLSLA